MDTAKKSISMISAIGRMPDQRGADGRPDDGLLGDGRVAHPLPPVLGGQPLGALHHPADGVLDVLAQAEHLGVVLHGQVDGLVDRLGQWCGPAGRRRSLRGGHRGTASPFENMSSLQFLGAGRVARPGAASTATSTSAVGLRARSRRARRRRLAPLVHQPPPVATDRLVGLGPGQLVAVDVLGGGAEGVRPRAGTSCTRGRSALPRAGPAPPPRRPRRTSRARCCRRPCRPPCRSRAKRSASRAVRV